MSGQPQHPSDWRLSVNNSSVVSRSAGLSTGRNIFQAVLWLWQDTRAGLIGGDEADGAELCAAEPCCLKVQVCLRPSSRQAPPPVSALIADLQARPAGDPAACESKQVWGFLGRNVAQRLVVFCGRGDGKGTVQTVFEPELSLPA